MRKCGEASAVTQSIAVRVGQYEQRISTVVPCKLQPADQFPTNFHASGSEDFAQVLSRQSAYDPGLMGLYLKVAQMTP